MDDLRERAKKLGYYVMPPSIDEFLDMVNIGRGVYPFWREVLRDIYPTPIDTKHPYIILTGAIGTGKSTVSKVMALYNLARLLCMKDLSAFSLTITKPIQFVFFHVNIEKSASEFVDSVEWEVESSPLFRDLRKHSKIPYQFVADGIRASKGIGGDVVFYTFSEANFVQEDRIIHKIDQAFKRYKSRFLPAVGHLGNIVIDTSSTWEGGVSQIVMERGEQPFVVRASQWEAKKHTGIFFRKGSFKVYLGDGMRDPFIIGDDIDLSSLDPERVLEVPEELRPDFEANLYEALISLAGIDIKAPDLFIKETDAIREACSIPITYPEVLEIVHIEQLIDWAYGIFKGVGYPLFAHIDTSLGGDRTGLAIGYHAHDGIHVPLAIAIQGSDKHYLSKIGTTIIKLVQRGVPVYMLTADRYQSYKLLQDISMTTRVKTRVLSVDTDPRPYMTLKQNILNGYIKLPQSSILIRELSQLRLMITSASRARIDHPVHGSKDLSDAVAAVSFTAGEYVRSKPVPIETITSYTERVIAKNLALQRGMIHRLWQVPPLSTPNE